jgi:hypothetical protein
LPGHLHRLLSQILGFLFVVSSTLFANWLWQKYTSEIDLKQELVEARHSFVALLHKVVEETDYNCTSGIGDTKCPFKLDAHNELLSSTLRDCLTKNSIEKLREIIRLGALCNGGRTSRKVTPASVKAKCLELKSDLHKIIESESLALREL